MPFSGRSVKDVDSIRFLSGDGAFVRDLRMAGMLHLAVLRSPYAHARISRVDLSRAASVPGVTAVLDGETLAKAVQPLPLKWQPVQGLQVTHHSLALRKIRYVGEPVAAVVAEDPATALDALERAHFDYEPLEPVVDLEDALSASGPLVHETLQSNKLLDLSSSAGDPASAFSRADLSVAETFRVQRLSGAPLEGRGTVATYRRSDGSMTVWSSTQWPHSLRTMLSEILGIPEPKIRVIGCDVGGAFGTKEGPFPEDVLCCRFSMMTGRPVKWVEERTESFHASIHAREQKHEIELALASDGTMVGLRNLITADMGAYVGFVGAGPPFITMRYFPGPYDLRNLEIRLRCVLTNKVPLGPYRGYGNPQAVFALERIIDRAASELRMDPVELRLKNLVKPDRFPYTNATGSVYDSGDYPEALRKAVELSEYGKFRNLQRVNQTRNGQKRYGVGSAMYIELTGVGPSKIFTPLSGLPGYDSTTVRIEPKGSVTVFTALQPSGQGLVTTMAQLVADEFGIEPADVTVVHSDTNSCPYGLGTLGSRSMIMAASGIKACSEKLREKMSMIAAKALGAQLSDIVTRNGTFYSTKNPEKTLSFKDVAQFAATAQMLPAGVQPSLLETHVHDPEGFAYSYGAHIVKVEVDIETGKVQLLDYVVVHDCGRVINPANVENQIYGGVAQGVGGAMFEEIGYSDDGQLSTTSFMDYLIPTSTDMHHITTEHFQTPSPLTAYGIKGVGESGVIPPAAAIANAVEDALRDFATVRELPLKPEKIYNLLRNGAQKSSAGVK